MTPQTGSDKRKPWDEEQMIFFAAIGASLVVAAGFCILLYALNSREKNAVADTEFPAQNTASVLIPPDHPRQLVDFSLTDRTDRTVTRSDLAGKILVVDFLFTSCSLTCPAVNGQMAQIQQLTTNDPDVKLISLTVDPRDDTPAVLAKYGERFGAETNRWLLLTGDKNTLYRLIGTSFLGRDLSDAYSYMPGNFSHTERIAVVDAHGRLCGYFDGLNQNTADAVAAEISKLRNQKL